MRMGLLVVLIALTFVSAKAVAQNVESKVTAPNGVEVTLNTDSFAGRIEYTAPNIKFDIPGGGSGGLLVGAIKKNGKVQSLEMSGYLVYSGEWQMFRTAVFKGGDLVAFTRDGGDVGGCQSRCTLTEDFTIRMTPDEIAKHNEGGMISIQLRPERTSNSFVISIPIAYIDAVRAVSK